MSSIVIGDNQVRVKDCFASAPNIDLTLRSNGEERVQVMDSVGQFVTAGFEAPTVAPTAAVVAVAAPGFAQPTWLVYRYVYAATKRYPLVENAITAGGNVSPRSNPSPQSLAVNINVANRAVDLTVIKSNRLDIDAVWIYRTDFFTDQADAEQAAAEGAMFYVGTIPSDGTGAPVVFQDRELTVIGNEQIEFDNFSAEQFWLCCYVPPYFYGFANLPFTGPVSITTAGLVTLTNPWSTANTTGDKWYDGRNRQIVTLEGIISGGFDGYGSFYFKWISPTEAQLCYDLQLLQDAVVGYVGTTTITIKGPPANLYRSKPNNPFSWGTSTLVGEIAVPAPYVHRVGGGQGTAMVVVPVLNLLKLDTEGPNKSYIFNLKSQGTDDFETSKQEISSDYSSSNHWCQFPAKTDKGDTLIWFLDNKYGVICRSDGSSNQEISGPVFESLKDFSRISEDRLMSHGAFDPRTQTSIIWITTNNELGGLRTQNDRAFIYHHPSNTWTTLDQKGVLCSAPYLDRHTNEQMVLVGSDTGRIGRFLAPDQYNNWLDFGYQFEWPRAGQQTGPDTVFYFSLVDFTIGHNLVGLWMLFTTQNALPDLTSKARNRRFLGWARVSAYVFDGLTGVNFTFDRFISANGLHSASFNDWIVGGTGANSYVCYLESILCNCCKAIDADDGTVGKSLAEVWVSKLEYNYPLNVGGGNLAGTHTLHGMLHLGYRADVNGEYQASQTFAFEVEKQRTLTDPPIELNGNNLYAKTPVALDKLKHFSVSLFDVGYLRASISNIQLVIKQGK